VSEPIACLLIADEYQERVRWIADLNRRFLQSAQQVGLTLALSYNLQAADLVHELVDRERRCCPFLTFHVHQVPDFIRLVIMAPEQAQPAAEELFAQFRAT
jgi:hypothetical protein